MKTYSITVQFTISRDFKIRAKNPEEAAHILDQRVTKTMRINNFDWPTIRFATVNGKEDQNSFEEGSEINSHTKVCEY